MRVLAAHVDQRGAFLGLDLGSVYRDLDRFVRHPLFSFLLSRRFLRSRLGCHCFRSNVLLLVLRTRLSKTTRKNLAFSTSFIASSHNFLLCTADC